MIRHAVSQSTQPGEAPAGPSTESVSLSPAAGAISEPPASSTQLTERPAGAVMASVENVHHLLSGELQVHSNPTLPSTLFTSSAVPIDARVSDKLKSKIWANEFIELGSLLVNPIFQDQYQITISNTTKGQSPSLSLESTAKPKRLANIETWEKAFRIFVGIYTQKYPQEAPSLMKYGEILHDLAARGQNWSF